MSDTTQIHAAKPSTTPFWWPEPRTALAVLTVGGWLVLLLVAGFVKPIDPGVINTATPLAALVLGWYFGSSKSSQDKDATIAAAVKGP